MDQTPNTAEPQKPRRRWFQFRLRTLLIGVTVLGSVCGGYVAHEAKIVADRKAWIDSPERKCECFMADPSQGLYSNHDRAPSALRRWFGDEEFDKIFVESSDDLPTTRMLFPEASVSLWQLNYHRPAKTPSKE